MQQVPFLQAFGGHVNASGYTPADFVRFWVIASITVSILGITYISMERGYGTIVPQLFYFPILYATYFYPRHGIWVAGGCACAYLVVAATAITPDPFLVSGVIFQALLFIAIAAVSAYVVRRQGNRRFVILEDEPGVAEALIRGGETDHTEFKLCTLWSADLTKDDIGASDSPEVRKFRNNASKFIIARAIAGFLNTDGGDLLIGIEEARIENSIRIAGLESDYHKMHEADRSPDGYRRMIIDSVVRKYLPEIADTASRFLHISFPMVSGKTICRIHIQPAERPVFVSTGSEEIFFIRTDASTRPITGRSLTDYTLMRFREG